MAELQSLKDAIEAVLSGEAQTVTEARAEADVGDVCVRLWALVRQVWELANRTAAERERIAAQLTVVVDAMRADERRLAAMAVRVTAAASAAAEAAAATTAAAAAVAVERMTAMTAMDHDDHACCRP